MSSSAWRRWAPLSGVVFIVLLVVGFLIAGDSPDPDDPAEEITTYLLKDSNQTKNIVAFILLLVALPFMVGFFGALRSRLAAAEGGVGRLATLAFGAGVASAVFLITAIS